MGITNDTSGYGLITGMANGIREGLIGYQTIQNQKHAQRMQELTAGVTKDENGELVLTPEALKMKQLQAQKSQAELNDYDPNSAAAKGMHQFLAAGAPNAGLTADAIPEGLSVHDYEKLQKPYDTSVTSNSLKERFRASDETKRDIADKKAEFEAQKIALARMKQQQANEDAKWNREHPDQPRAAAGKGGMTAYQAERLKRVDENMGFQANKTFNNDNIMTQLNKTQQGLDRAMGMMDGKAPITESGFNVIQQDFINAMAPGGAATEGKVNREMVHTAWGKINELQQKYGSIQDLRQQAPEQFEQLRQMIHQVKHDYSQAQKNRYSEIAEGYEGTSNQAIKGLLKKKQERFAPEPAAAPPAADDSVKMLAPDGTTRLIPKSQLKDALEAGGKLVP